MWVDDADGAPWEIYTVLADAETAPTGALRSDGTTTVATATPAPCCAARPDLVEQSVPAGSR